MSEQQFQAKKEELDEKKGKLAVLEKELSSLKDDID